MSDLASRDEKASLDESNQADDMETKKEAVASDATGVAVTEQYPSTQKRIVIMIALYLAVFLVTLVRIRGFSAFG
jgi:hypothetical protein